ncbi:putative membrane protein [Burkholderia cepacia]|nr:putative membrane protein [Burkholderia cepacia]
MFRGARTGKSFAFVLGWSVALLVILLYAQTQAFYTVG